MKKFFLALAKALGYVAVFLIIQVAVTVAAAFIFTITFILHSSSSYSSDDLTQAIMSSLLGQQLGWIVFLTSAVTLLAVFLFFLIRKRPFLESIYFNRISLPTVLCCFVLGIALNFFISGMLDILPIPDWMLQNYSSASALTAGLETNIWYALDLAVLAPITEEVIFRGLSFFRLKGNMPLWAAILIQAVFFGAAHGDLLWFCYTSFAAVIFALACNRFHSILPSIFMHIALNTTSLMLMLRYNDLSERTEWILFGLSALLLTAALIWYLVTGRKLRKRSYAAVPVAPSEGE